MNKVIGMIVTAFVCVACAFTGDGVEKAADHAGANAAHRVPVVIEKFKDSRTAWERRFTSSNLAVKFAMSFAADFNANRTNNVKIISSTYHKDGTVTFRFVPKFHTCKEKHGEPVHAKDDVKAKEVTVRFGMAIINGKK